MGKHCEYRTLVFFELAKPAKNRIELNHDFCGSHWSEGVTSEATTGRWRLCSKRLVRIVLVTTIVDYILILMENRLLMKGPAILYTQAMLL
jgi:hypothetical protein